MKLRFLILPLLLVFLSCDNQDDLPQMNETSVLKYSGSFVPTVDIEASGQAKIYVKNKQYRLELSAFSVTSGPDLKVYLSKADTPTDFVSLGDLTSATSYSIPESVDVSMYSHVLIHCEEYNHLFAVAAITSN